MARLERMVRSKKDLKRVDLDVVIRFLNILSETNVIGITKLQMKTGTNHSTCVKYVKLLERLGLAKSVIHGRKKDVSITERGREALKILSV